jgi:hypothetical protein
MAIKTVSKANTDAPDADYPYGNVRDKAPGIAGTPMNTALIGDALQFFERMMGQAGITPNDLPDNVTNTFQLYDALLATINALITAVPTLHVVGATGQPVFEGGSLPSSIGNDLRFYKIGNEVVIDGSFRANHNFALGDNAIFTLPAGFRPQLTTQRFPLIDSTDGSYKTYGILVTSAGYVGWYNDTLAVGSFDVFVGQIRFKLA